MNLPRWTVYPAVVVLVLGMVAFVPRRARDPNRGAAAMAGVTAVAPADETAPKAEPFPRVAVLGIDGLDPDVLLEVVQRFPELTPNFRALIEIGGLHELGTSTPPQSPVAWSNFVTGLDPGGHGVFDFIHRDPRTRLATTSTTREGKPSALARTLAHVPLPGAWTLPASGETETNRTGEAFWRVLARHGVPADIWRMPANFPVVPSKGLSFSGMMTPALDSAYGECTFYTSDPFRAAALSYDKLEIVRESAGRIDTRLAGPPNAFREGAPRSYAPLTVFVDREAGAAVIEVGGAALVLRPGEWSEFARVRFSMLPAGLSDVPGIARFYLRSLTPEFELYASAVNIDPSDPAMPVSEPVEASAEVARAIGLYYTQGMAEDVNALKKHLLTDEEFADQAGLVHDESRRMLDVALERYLERRQGGLLFFYFSGVDLGSHMLWRHSDREHPEHDAEFAARSSERWSGRKGSTWRDATLDLVLKMDPIVGHLREELGEQATLIVMSDHGFAPYARRFNLNTWLVQNGYLVLKPGVTPELPAGDPGFRQVTVGLHTVDWSRTRAYGVGFQSLYLNLRGREQDDPETPEDESGIVAPGAEADALARELASRLEALVDPSNGRRPILRCDLASEVYSGARAAEAPDLVVGYDSGYGNSDQSTTGRIPHDVLEDNAGGSFNGSPLMAPAVVAGTLLANRPVRAGGHRLEDLTVEVLERFGIPPQDGMKGHPVLE